MTPSAWRLVRDSFRDLATHWGTYLLIVALVAVPANLLALIPTLAENTNIDAYSTLAAFFMTVALLYAIHQFATGSKSVPLGDAYYNGGSHILSFLLVGIWWSLMAIPLIAAVFIYIIGTYPQDGVVVPLSEHLIIGGICLLIALVSFWLFTRFSLALPLVVQRSLRPFAALKRARALTMDRFWRVFIRLFAMTVIAAVSALFIYLPVFGLSLLTPGLAPVLFVIYQLIVTLVVLTFINVYLYKLARTLDEVTP